MRGNLILLIALLFGILQSCNNDYKALRDAAPIPVINMSKDTIKTREKDINNINQTDNGILYIKSNSSHHLNIQIQDTSGFIHFEYKGIRLKTEFQPLLVTDDTTSVYCICDTAGVYGITFLLTDQLGKTASQKLIVKCYSSPLPVAAFTYQLIDSTQQDNWVYKIDATSSYKVYGKIVKYNFLINNQLIQNNTPAFSWSFHTRGLQTIKLAVTDDLQRNSDTLTKIIVIQ